MLFLSDVSGSTVRQNELNEVLNKHGFELIMPVRLNVSGGFMNYFLPIKEVIHAHKIYLSEFPCNCSMLIIGNVEIELQLDDSAQRIINMGDALLNLFNYGGYIITGTVTKTREYLKSNGFEILIDDLFNPHSGKQNWIAIKRKVK